MKMRWAENSHSDHYGSVEWQPAIEGADELKSKQDELKSAFITHDLQESCIRKIMAETYSIQRATINKGSAVNAVMEVIWSHMYTPWLSGANEAGGGIIKKKENPWKTSLIKKGWRLNAVMIPDIAKLLKENPEHLYCQN